MSSYYDDASLMLLASGGAQKDGKVYSVKPTDGSGDFTFTRGSNLSATRVNASQLIEKGRENLLLQSNQFDTTWFNSNSTETSGQSGYDGSSDAWLLESTGASGSLRQSISYSSVICYSFYAKAGTANYVRLRLDAATQVNAWFNLSSGSVGTLSDGISSSMESVGNGWWRVSVTANVTSLTTIRVYPSPNDAGGNSSGDNILIQDAQLEQGLAASPYIETGATSAQAGILENTPRFDYSGGATCPSLLLEPSRTNVLEYSEYFDSSYYTKASGTSLDFGYLAPDGTNSAYKLSGNTATVYAPSTINGSYSRSIWARTTSGTGTAQLCSYFGNTNNIFNITEEWQRFEISSLTTSIGDTNFYTADLRGVSTLNEIIIWGAQAENASYPTSYIPTYGVSQTRAADSIYADNIGQTTAYTIFLDYKNLEQADSNFQDYISFQASLSNQDGIRAEGVGSTWRLYGYGLSGSVGFPITGSINKKKKAIVISTAGVKLFEDGELTTQDLSGLVIPELGAITTRRGTSAPYPTEIKQSYNQIIVFPTALSDLECEILTGATTYNTFAAMALALNYTVYE